MRRAGGGFNVETPTEISWSRGCGGVWSSVVGVHPRPTGPRWGIRTDSNGLLWRETLVDFTFPRPDAVFTVMLLFFFSVEFIGKHWCVTPVWWHVIYTADTVMTIQPAHLMVVTWSRSEFAFQTAPCWGELTDRWSTCSHLTRPPMASCSKKISPASSIISDSTQSNQRWLLLSVKRLWQVKNTVKTQTSVLLLISPVAPSHHGSTRSSNTSAIFLYNGRKCDMSSIFIYILRQTWQTRGPWANSGFQL